MESVESAGPVIKKALDLQPGAGRDGLFGPRVGFPAEFAGANDDQVLYDTPFWLSEFDGHGLN
jgi:hypothetical protein